MSLDMTAAGNQSLRWCEAGLQAAAWILSRQLLPRCVLLVLGALGNVGHAGAAGGSHFVEDAVMLAPGQCQVEVWADRDRKGNRKLLHVGPACRAGPLEVGLNFDHISSRSAGTGIVAGPQVKWTRALTDSASMGVVVAAGWQDTLPRFLGTTVVFPVTWQAHPALVLHGNAGWDIRHKSSDTARVGVSIDWVPSPAWTLMGERFRESDMNFWRAGVRYALNSRMTIDLTRVAAMNGATSRWWTLGLTHVFDGRQARIR